MYIEPLEVTDEVENLLSSAGLPVADLRDGCQLQLFGVRSDDQIIGLIGIESHGTVGLLRSLVVIDTHRKGGYGQALVTQAEAWACRNGMETLYLLTTTASDFFARHGYVEASRSQAPDSIVGTAQFAGLCPALASFMCKELGTNSSNQGKK
ncbi:arsenic resistance N-acetyltransferase ArsN2 [Nitrincola sp. MINF-07-Sa-05]|uniref:arsenic resistance N-acetyltransferase ArsN2 n=1 Tax=Nitrincola salilacus TaxID=3400273 RepID=UPI0039185F8D